MKKSPKKTKSEELKDDARMARRRGLLGVISAVGGVGATKLPEQWTRPVVDSVLLPAHAQSTEEVCEVTCTSFVLNLIEYPQTGTSTSFFTYTQSAYHVTDCAPIGDTTDTTRSSEFFSSFNLNASSIGSTSFTSGPSGMFTENLCS